MYNRTCNNCKKKYIGRGKKFCSHSCVWKGLKHTPATIIKMKNSATGVKRPWAVESAKKMSKNNLGKKRPPFSETWKQNISISLTGGHPNVSEKTREDRRNSFSGINNPNYQGGITPFNLVIRSCSYYIKWRTQVFIRDNFTCQDCGNNKGGNLEAHHIKSLSKILKNNKITNLEEAIHCKELWNIDNGKTLCIDCHKKTDTYGNKKVLS